MKLSEVYCGKVDSCVDAIDHIVIGGKKHLSLKRVRACSKIVF